MVGLLALDQSIGVRVPASQPNSSPSLRDGSRRDRYRTATGVNRAFVYLAASEPLRVHPLAGLDA